jgi:hypothetical protein
VPKIPLGLHLDRVFPCFIFFRDSSWAAALLSFSRLDPCGVCEERTTPLLAADRSGVAGWARWTTADGENDGVGGDLAGKPAMEHGQRQTGLPD